MKATRRQLVGRAGLALGAALLAGVPDVAAARDVLPASGDEETVLHAAIGLEQASAFAYAHLPSLGRLRGGPAASAARFRAQEQRHVDVLSSSLQSAGVRPPAPPRTVAQADRILQQAGLGPRLADVGSPHEAVGFAIALEVTEIGAWYEAQRKFVRRDLLAIAAQILANEAQHATVWRGLASDEISVVVPAAFEHGSAAP